MSSQSGVDSVQASQDVCAANRETSFQGFELETVELDTSGLAVGSRYASPLHVLAMSLCVILASLALFGCGAQGSSGQASSDAATNSKVVRLGGVMQGDYLTGVIGLAQQKGYLADELQKVGYTLEVQGSPTGPSVNEALTSGAVDVACAGDLPALVCADSGLDTKLIGLGENTHYGLLAREGLGVQTVGDLKGHRVAASPGTVIQHFLDGILADNGLNSSSDIEQVVSANTGDTLSELTTGQIDAVALPLYLCYQYEAKGLGSVIATSVDHPELNSSSVIYAPSSYLDANPEVAPAFERALEHAVRDTQADPNSFYEFYSRALNGKVDASSFEKDFSQGDLLSTIEVGKSDATLSRLENLEQYAHDNKLIKSDVDVSDWFYE